MKFKQVFVNYVSTRSSILTDIIWAIFEEIEKRITFLKVILAIVIPWLAIIILPYLQNKLTYLYNNILYIFKILNDLPLLVDQKDFCLIVTVVFLIIVILLSFIREFSNYLIRINFYLMLIFFMFSKLALN